jgi:hypothetical protein
MQDNALSNQKNKQWLKGQILRKEKQKRLQERKGCNKTKKDINNRRPLTQVKVKSSKVKLLSKLKKAIYNSSEV